jgi:hypothetical protein
LAWQPDLPRGLHNHRLDSIEFFKVFLDITLVNNPYNIQFYSDNYTQSVADFTGTFDGPMEGLNGKQFHLPLRDFIYSSVPLLPGIRK